MFDMDMTDMPEDMSTEVEMDLPNMPMKLWMIWNG